MNEFLYTYGLPIVFGLVGFAGIAHGIAHGIAQGRGWCDYDEVQHQQDIEIARAEAQNVAESERGRRE